jgi:hypothetical protein
MLQIEIIFHLSKLAGIKSACHVDSGKCQKCREFFGWIGRQIIFNAWSATSMQAVGLVPFALENAGPTTI